MELLWNAIVICIDCLNVCMKGHRNVLMGSMAVRKQDMLGATSLWVWLVLQARTARLLFLVL